MFLNILRISASIALELFLNIVISVVYIQFHMHNTKGGVALMNVSREIQYTISMILCSTQNKRFLRLFSASVCS